MSKKYEWPFKVHPEAKIRFLERAPIDLPPPQINLSPRQRETCSFGEQTPGRIPVRVLSINGVPQRDTHLRLRPETLAKIMEEVRRCRDEPLDASD
jgi:hypothetical protein